MTTGVFFEEIMQKLASRENYASEEIYKGKEDALQCGKYRGLRLLEHGMKIWERVLCERLKCVTEVDENQLGFMAGRSTTGAILSFDSCRRNT